MSITKDMREAHKSLRAVEQSNNKESTLLPSFRCSNPEPADILHPGLGHMVEPASVGRKDDGGKPDLTLVPVALEEACARALSFGARKYGRNNFRAGIKYTRVLAACLRHLRAWNERSETDAESGLSHLDHAVACLAMLAHYESEPELKAEFDDRDLKRK